MYRLIITTQVYENYGAHTWDGEGECPQHWKAKGGDDYVVANFTLNQFLDLFNEGTSVEQLAQQMIDRYRDQIECWDDYYREYVIGWDLVEGLTVFEQNCIKWDGSMNGTVDLTEEGRRVCPVDWNRDLRYADINAFFDQMEAENG